MNEKPIVKVFITFLHTKFFVDKIFEHSTSVYCLQLQPLCVSLTLVCIDYIKFRDVELSDYLSIHRQKLKKVPF